MTCIVAADEFVRFLAGSLRGPVQCAAAAEMVGGTAGYRVLRHQADGMPELIVGKEVLSLDDAKAHAGKLWAPGCEVNWGQPTDEEKAIAGGIVCVMRIAESGTGSAGMDDLRRWIENALGEPRPAAIQMGAVGPSGLVAWIEKKDEIASLFVAGGGRMLTGRSLARGDTLDFWYEGCDVQQLAWYGDRLVVVSRERGTYLRSIDPDGGAEEGMALADAWRIDRDLVFWAGDEPGLLYTAALPGLDVRPPLPFRGTRASGDIRLGARRDGWVEILQSGEGGNGAIDTIALPTRRQRAEYAPVAGLFDAVERRLFRLAGAPMAGRLVIEAVALPFVSDARWRGRWQPAPVWMPVYWHRHLISRGRVSEAGELLDLLDTMAAPLPDAEPECGWDPGWNAAEGQIELAARHVRRRARVIARTCRSGMLPAGRWCLLFDPAPQSSVPGSRVDSTGFPPVLRQVFEDLAPTSPARLASSR